MNVDLKEFIGTYLMPAIDSYITDGELRTTIYRAIDEAETDIRDDYKERENNL